MKIQFPCRKCQTTLSAAEEKAGRQGKCPKCGHLFVVPTPPPLDLDEDLPVAAVVATAAPVARKSSPTPPPPAEKKSPPAAANQTRKQPLPAPATNGATSQQVPHTQQQVPRTQQQAAVAKKSPPKTPVPSAAGPSSVARSSVPNRLAMGTPTYLKHGETLVPAKLIGSIPQYLAAVAAAAERAQQAKSAGSELLPAGTLAKPGASSEPLATVDSLSVPPETST